MPVREAIVSLIGLAFCLCLPLTWLVRAVSHKLQAHDTAPIPGQVKEAHRQVPNTGGIAIFLAFGLPLLVATAVITWSPSLLTGLVPSLSPHLPGLASSAGKVLWFLLCLTVMHVMGLVDDRRPLGPMPKLGVMLAVALAAVLLTDTRLVTALDAYPGGYAASVAITCLWIVVISNAMNFMDNTDGLTAGVAVIAGGCFLAAALLHDQWFIGAALALLVGACLGFLVLNFPSRLAGPERRASIYMGDAGSLVIGFALAYLTVRTTFIPTDAAGIAITNKWYGLFMPVLVLAVPLYDFVSVCVIRLRLGRSPFRGDLNHLSHRLVRMGLSKRDAVLVIYGATGITSIGGIALGSLAPWQAILVVVQTLLVLLVMAIFESRRKPLA